MRNDEAEIIRLIWSRRKGVEGKKFNRVSGGEISIIKCGEPVMDGDSFAGAEIEIDGRVVRGEVVFGVPPIECISEYAILQVVTAPAGSLISKDGRRLPQIIFEIPPEVCRSVDSLVAGSGNYECGLWLADIDRLTRTSIFEKLLIDRLRRKCADIMEVFGGTGGDWSQTFHIMLFRSMGGNRNRRPYMKLASRATYAMVLRERSSVAVVEALLLGTSGLLEGCYFDDYIHQLRDHYKYLCAKYEIVPMQAFEWESGGNYPRSMPIQRIVQLASFLSVNDFIFDRMISCRERDDIQKLFDAESSHYWTTHYIPDGSSRMCPKRIGEEKADLLGINLVVPMMFAYGHYTGKEELKEAAMDLITAIPAEKNTIIRGWTGCGVPVSSAMDSQALLQLRNEYCENGCCIRCSVGRNIIKTP